MELPEIHQGLDLASSGESGRALTDTLILCIFYTICVKKWSEFRNPCLFWFAVTDTEAEERGKMEDC